MKCEFKILSIRCVHFRNCTSLKGVKSITSIFNRKDPNSILVFIKSVFLGDNFNEDSYCETFCVPVTGRIRTVAD